MTEPGRGFAGRRGCHVKTWPGSAVMTFSRGVMGYEENGLLAIVSSGIQAVRGPKGDPAPCQNVLRGTSSSSVSPVAIGWSMARSTVLSCFARSSFPVPESRSRNPSIEGRSVKSM